MKVSSVSCEWLHRLWRCHSRGATRGHTGRSPWAESSPQQSSPPAPFSLRQMSVRTSTVSLASVPRLREKSRHSSGTPCPPIVVPAIMTGRQALESIRDWASGTVPGLVPPTSPIFQIPQRPGSLGSDPRSGRAAKPRAQGGLSHYSL